MGELNLDEIEAILATPEPTKRKAKTNVEDRTITTWFKLFHTFQRPCEVPAHEVEERKAACVIINDVAMCRKCFLGEKDKV